MLPRGSAGASWGKELTPKLLRSFNSWGSALLAQEYLTITRAAPTCPLPSSRLQVNRKTRVCPGIHTTVDRERESVHVTLFTAAAKTYPVPGVRIPMMTCFVKSRRQLLVACEPVWTCLLREGATVHLPAWRGPGALWNRGRRVQQSSQAT